MARSFAAAVAAGAVLAFAAHAAPSAASDAGDSAYFRYPAVHGDTLVFTAEGDLWTAPIAGGAARRLTTAAGEETEAAISPDGRLVAFAAAYDGPTEAYVMPLSGGEPKRVSFDGARVTVEGWTPDGRIVYASEHVRGPRFRRVLREVDPATLAETELPLADANQAAFDDAGRELWFTRFGLHLTGDHAKRYRGGALAQLWRFALDGKAEAVRLASDVDAALMQPMWWQGRLYYLGDESGSFNLWSMAPDGSDRRQLTRHEAWDARSARLADGRIVYTLGADIHLYDIASGADRVVPLTLASDEEQALRRWLREPQRYLTAANFSPDGRRVVLTARGRVVLAGVGNLRRIDIDAPYASRAREAVASPDGKWVYTIEDSGGSNEIWRYPADGSPAGVALTHGGTVHRWRLYSSPDGKWIAHDDKHGTLWLLDVASGKDERIDDGGIAGDDGYANVVWSPDSKTLAFVRANTAQQRNQVLAYDLAAHRVHVLTSDRYESFAPAYSRDGHWLYFLSNRHFEATPGSPWGDRNMGPMFDRRTGVFALALQQGERFPFQPTDELHPDDKSRHAEDEAAAADAQDGKSKDTKGREAKQEGKAKPLPPIEWEGLAERLYEVPVAAGNYSKLAADNERLYLLDADAGADAKPKLKVLEIARNGPKAETFMADVADFALSADGKKLYLRKHSKDGAGEMYIVDAGAKAPPPDDLAKLQVRLGDWVLPITPRDEWREMFADAWRMHRDFAFDPKLRGLDWTALRAKYEALLPRVRDRSELDDLIGQMTSELGILHSQVRGADLRSNPELAAAASLGADYGAAAKGVTIAHIYRSDPEVPSTRGPLAQPGIDVREGDVLLAINGREVHSRANVAAALMQQAGQQVLLEVARGGAKPHKVVVTAVAADRDAQLRYEDWVEGEREKVEAAGKGRIGYLHLRAMGSHDIETFARDFYANYDRDGLVIDVRRNTGGNIDSWVIEKLLRRAWAFWKAPVGPPQPNMQQAFRGHLVVLVDHFTYSDGETFAAGIKALGLGPLIGTRTAGAGIWLSDRNQLSDNGTARVAEFPQFRASDGHWIVEGRGVAPDIEVEDSPLETWRGDDRQLDAALDYLAKKLREAPIPPLQAQPIPQVGTPAGPVR